MLVLSTYHSQEELKRRLVEIDSSFFTVASKNPTASYRVLWYRRGLYGEKCKVDLLLPGVMSIPSIPSSSIVWIDGLPVAPFSMVLLLKLQAWDDHKKEYKTYLNLKQHTDVKDIDYMLPLAQANGLEPRKESTLPTSFIQKAEGRVRDYTRSFPNSAKYWKALGFEAYVVPDISSPSYKYRCVRDGLIENLHL